MNIEKIKNNAKRIPGLLPVYRFFKNIIYSAKTTKKLRNFNKESLFVIGNVQNCLEKTKYKFFFDMGTLLGMYRDKELIKRDMDIDVAIFVSKKSEINSLCKYLKKYCWKHRMRFLTNLYGIVQDTFELKGVRIDLCYYKVDGKYDKCYLLYDDNNEKNKIVELSCKHINTTRKMFFKNLLVNVPALTEQYLNDRYGANWRIPDKNYKYWEGPSTKKMPGIGKCRQL